MAGITNRGKLRILEMVLRRTYNGGSLPTNYYVALVTSATAPTADTNTMSDLTEITAGNGYTSGGYQLTPGATDFDATNEDDTGDDAYVQVKDIGWTASGGPIPASGSDGAYAVLTDDNGTVANREVLAWWATGALAVADGQQISLVDLQLDATEAV